MLERLIIIIRPTLLTGKVQFRGKSPKHRRLMSSAELSNISPDTTSNVGGFTSALTAAAEQSNTEISNISILNTESTQRLLIYQPAAIGIRVQRLRSCYQRLKNTITIIHAAKCKRVYKQ